MYLFCAQTDGEVDDWRKGKHNFRQLNGGQSGVLSNEFDEGMTKKVARIVTKEKARGDARFQRISWWYPSRPTVILIQVQLQYTILFMKKTPYMCLDMLSSHILSKYDFFTNFAWTNLKYYSSLETRQCHSLWSMGIPGEGVTRSG